MLVFDTLGKSPSKLTVHLDSDEGGKVADDTMQQPT